MSEECYLYMFLHADESAIKIGVANNIIQRAAAIPHEILFDRSLMAAGSRDACYRAEGVMHRLLQRYRLDRLDGSGGTEWFSADCRAKAEQLFEVLREEIGIGRLEACKVKKRPPTKAHKVTTEDPGEDEALKNEIAVSEVVRAIVAARPYMEIIVSDFGRHIQFTVTDENLQYAEDIYKSGGFHTKNGGFNVFTSLEYGDGLVRVGFSGESIKDADPVFTERVRQDLLAAMTMIAA